MDVNEQLEQIKKLLHTHLEKMEKDKSELATLYTKTFYTRKWYDEKGDEHPYKENEFDSLYKINVEYMKMICTPFTGHPVKGVFLCVILTNLRKKLLNCIAKENGLMHPMI